jgi:hypothetical protein
LTASYKIENRSVYTKAESMGVWIRLFEFVFENKNSSLEKCTELCYKHSKEYQE